MTERDFFLEKGNCMWHLQWKTQITCVKAVPKEPPWVGLVPWGPVLLHCQPQSINKLQGVGSASCPQLNLSARWFYMLPGNVVLSAATEGISIPNYPDTCMCDRGRSTDLSKGWHGCCRNMEVLVKMSAWTQKCPMSQDSDEAGWKRESWIQCYQSQRARMGWVQSSKYCYPKNTASLQRSVQSQFFRWVSFPFFF